MQETEQGTEHREGGAATDLKPGVFQDRSELYVFIGRDGAEAGRRVLPRLYSRAS